MELAKRLVKFLKRHKIFYQVQVHPETMTALETAEAEHICGKSLAKVVMVKNRGRDAMVVIPCDRNVDLLKLSNVLGTEDLEVSEEQEFSGLFPDCEPGAMPPFGRIYKIPCYADERLSLQKELYFNAGNHQETVKISVSDFLKYSKALIGDFSVPAECFARFRKAEKDARRLEKKMEEKREFLFIGESV